jgi:hypothetical protein
LSDLPDSPHHGRRELEDLFTHQVQPRSLHLAGCHGPWEKLPVNDVQTVLDTVYDSGTFMVKVDEVDAWVSLVSSGILFITSTDSNAGDYISSE